MADDLSSNREFRRLIDRVRRLENTLMLQDAAISEGGLTVISSDPGLVVEGLLRVTGTEIIDGTLQVTGTITLTGDLTVSGSGRIKAGNIVIDPSTAGGQIGFGSNRRIDAGSGYLGVYDGTRFIVFNSSGIALNAGGPNIVITDTKILVNSLPTVPKASVPGAFADAIVYWAGELRRAV